MRFIYYAVSSPEEAIGGGAIDEWWQQHSSASDITESKSWHRCTHFHLLYGIAMQQIYTFFLSLALCSGDDFFLPMREEFMKIPFGSSILGLFAVAATQWIAQLFSASWSFSYDKFYLHSVRANRVCCWVFNSCIFFFAIFCAPKWKMANGKLCNRIPVEVHRNNFPLQSNQVRANTFILRKVRRRNPVAEE